jgi:starch phosphorylase
MKSAYALKQNVIGIGILWKYGYYDQGRDGDQLMQVQFIKKQYSFLQDTGIVFPVSVHGHPVYVKAYYLSPEYFGTAPLFFLSTDIPENDFLSRSITHHLYDKDEAAKIAQSIILGVGGGKLLDILEEAPDVYHMNEGHALPLLFYLYSKFKNKEEVRKRFVFTTHTPELAGNEEHKTELLKEMDFFCGIPLEEVKEITLAHGETLNYTLTALRFAKIANGVSQIHGNVSNEMWKHNEGICKIIAITNAQNKEYWMDKKLKEALDTNNDEWLSWQKKEYKKELLQIVADQTGKIFDPEKLTIVWARRFAGYKRADLITRNYHHFLDLVSRAHNPVQIIWAGKPYPFDYYGIQIFNHLVQLTENIPSCAVLTGYELKLSAQLKKGADVWLNNPRFPREASGTSGMTATMNGTVNLSIADGWFPEFVRQGENGFVFYPSKHNLEEIQDNEDNYNLMNVLENEIIPTFYNDKQRWLHVVKTGMREVVPAFDSDRMAQEYYDKLYNA